MTGWTPPPTFVPGPLTAAVLNTYLSANLLAINPPPIIKSAAESLNLSTSLQDDDELTYAIAATGSFEFHVRLAVSSATNAAGDFKVGFTFPAGTMNFFGRGPDVGLASGNIGTSHHGVAVAAVSGTTALAFGCSTTAAFIEITGILVATATGTLTLQWAQQASDANNTTVGAGSFMTIRQVA